MKVEKVGEAYSVFEKSNDPMENMQGLERVQNELPKLQKTLQDIGITTRSVSTRLGTIHMNNSQENSFSATDNGRKLNETFSVDA